MGLRCLSPHRATYGYDVLVYVGYGLFVRAVSEQQIISELAQRNVFISQCEIGFLGKKFITYLAIAHQQSRQRLKQAMALRGGYILHFFRDLKRRNRRKSGTVSLNKTLKFILADTPLVKNLDNAEYLEIILDGSSTLEECFEKIDSRLVVEKLKDERKKNERISPEMEHKFNLREFVMNRPNPSP